MPIFTNETGSSVWKSGESKPALYVGNPNSQMGNLEIRRERTVASTARAMGMGMTEEELADVIGKNAQTVEMDPEELRDLAIQYLEWKEANSNGIERE